MTTIVASHSHSAGTRRFPAIAGMAVFVVGMIARAIRMRRDRAALQEMPDHLLRDMGISRSEIFSATAMWPRDVSRLCRD